MSNKNRMSKPVAFNKTNELDAAILEYVKDLNFSGYVKDLIVDDMNKKDEVPQVETLEQIVPIPEIEPAELLEQNEPIQATIEPIKEVVPEQPIEPIQPIQPDESIEKGITRKKENGETIIIIR